MSEFINYQELPDWVPGRVLLASDGLGWKNVACRSYHYEGQDVIVPSMKDFLLVGYRNGVTPMQRRYEGRWTRETLGPGAASLLTRAQRVNWNWIEPIDVTHVYLSGALVAEVASEVLDCAVTEVSLADVLRTEDPVMTLAMEQIAREAETKGLGGALYVDSVSRALVVHLLRRYADIRRPVTGTDGALTATQQRQIVEFIDTHLASGLDLKSMADALGLTPCLFARQFRSSFGKPPYAFVTAQRMARAQRLLASTDAPIKTVALDCGFSDQAHLTRMFRVAIGKTPAVFRRQAQ
ncbi:helix-turn-helix transcriptional regulator [Stappia sp. BW2]|uniref:helix-turn-helix domain-containing protein n=1 Tax=Stappia sp. BW2 TaxID=2592622 RepID=UPI0011DECC71|nr:AraC family transcriptional regulator [Stappia sp. BW2]TYC80125.1 helix-turn-helix transcriptional regulator [Stappia sp. BW2]